MAETLWLVGIAVVLLVCCLVVREQTEKWLRGLAVEVRVLRNQEKRIADDRKEVEKIAHQLREVSLRADRRQYELEEVSDRFYQSLGALHLAIREEELPAREGRPNSPDEEDAGTDEAES